MTRLPVYSPDECIALMEDCSLDELVALSSLLIEEWKLYPLADQVVLLSGLVKRRKELHHNTVRKFLYLRSRNTSNGRNHFS